MKFYSDILFLNNLASTSTIIAAKRENLPNLDLDDAKDEYEEEEG
jgi:hypothetical protein